MNGALFDSVGGLLPCCVAVEVCAAFDPSEDVNGTPATVVDASIVVVPSVADEPEPDCDDAASCMVVVEINVVGCVTVLPRESVVVTVLTAPGLETVVVIVEPAEFVVVKTTGT